MHLCYSEKNDDHDGAIYLCFRAHFEIDIDLSEGEFLWELKNLEPLHNNPLPTYTKPHL